MISILSFFILMLLFSLSISAGQIYTWDLTQDFNNYDNSQQIAINFKLQTALPSDSYLRLRMPFAIEGVSLSAFYIESDLCTLSSDYKLATITKSLLSFDFSTNTYLIQFYSEFFSITTTPNTLYSLLNNVWYKLMIVFASPISLNTNTINPLEMTTISSNSDHFILFDSNRIIGNIFYKEPPKPTLSISINQINADIMTTNNVIITVQPFVTILNQGRFNLILTNSKFSFKTTQTCEIKYFKLDPTLSVSLNNTTCELESSTSLLLSIPAQLENTLHYQIEAQINYPSYLESSQIKVSTMYAFTKTLVEISTNNIEIMTKQVEWNPITSTVKIGWGINLKPQTSPLFGLYRNGPVQEIYNNIRFYFSPLVSIPSNINGKLIIYFGVSAIIVQNSFSHNFIGVSGLSVSCTLTSNTITCINVAGFQASTLYSIAIKICLAYDALNSNTIPSDFANVLYYPMFKGSYTSISLVTSKLYTITIPIINNIDRLFVSSSTDYQGVHTKDNTIEALGTSGFGIKYKGSSTTQVLEFDLAIKDTDFSSATIGFSAGLDIYTSNIIGLKLSHIYTYSDCYSKVGGLYSVIHIGVCAITNGPLASGNSIGSTNLKIGYSFSAATSEGTPYAAFGFNKMMITRHASIYVDDNVLDFYIGFVESGFTSTGIAVSYHKTMMINSFTISIPDTFSSVKVALSNFWTSTTGTGSLTGNYLTAFIRITGFLSSSETSNKFFVFFDYLSGYYDSNPSSKIPRCGFSTSGDCSYNKGLDIAGINYPLLNRYEITLKSLIFDSVQFQIVMPVSSIATKKSIKVFFASQSSGIIINIMRFSLITNPVSFSSWNLLNTLGYSSIVGANYGIQNRGVNMVGKTESITINSYHSDSSSIFHVNDATNFGAAFTYITNYNFVNSLALPIFTYTLSGTNPGESCVYLKYLYTSSYKYVIYCPIYSSLIPNTVSSNVLIKNYKLPYIGGVSLTADSLISYASISNNDGLVLHYEKDIAEEVMIPNVITFSANPLVGFLHIGEKDGVIGFSFTITNNLPSISRIALLTVEKTSYYFVISEALNCEIISNSGIIIPEYSCVQSYNLNKIEAIITLTDNSKEITASSYKLYFKGINVNDKTPIIQNFFMKTMNYNGDTIDQSASNKLIYSSQEKLVKILIENVDFEHLNSLARGFCNISFVLGNKSIRADQYLKLKLEALSEDNQENSMHYMCHVRYVLNDSIAFIFKTCQFINKFNEIILAFKVDFNDLNVKFKVVLRNIRMPSSVNPYNFSIGLYSVNNYPILISEEYRLPQFSKNNNVLKYPQIILYKLYNTLGAKTFIIFEISLQKMKIDKDATILIKFPHYYTPFLSDKSKIVAYFNEELLQNIVILEYSIRISNVKTEIPINKIFNITITGVDLPYFEEVSSFFLGFYNKDPINLIEFGDISDLLSSLPNTVELLNVYNLSIYTNFTLEYSNYDFLISFTPNITSNQYILFIDFSLDWGAFLYYFPITCFLKSLIDDQFTKIPCFFKGLQLFLNLANNYTANVYYTFRINLRNPDTFQCNLRKFTVNLALSTSVNINFRSTPFLLNIKPLQFFLKITYPRWKYEIKVNGEYQKITNLIINQGTYSQEIRWSLLSGDRVNQNIQLTLQNVYYDTFALYPENPVLSVGSNETFFRIGTPQSTPPDVYDLFFNINQNPLVIYYGKPETIHLTVLKERVIVPNTNLFYVNIAVLGSSLPVFIDMEANPPYVEMNILTQLDFYPDLGLDFILFDKFVINVMKPVGSIVFKSLYLSDSFYKQTVAFLSLDENSIGLFDLNTVYVVPNLIESTNASITDVNITVYKNYSTMILIEASCSNMGYLYYHIQNNDSALERDFVEIFSLNINGFIYDFFDPEEENLGLFAYYSPKTKQNFTINKLRANRSYKLRLWTYDLNGNESLINVIYFTTNAKNDTYYIRAKIVFKSTINSQELQMLACFFCSFFHLTINQ